MVKNEQRRSDKSKQNEVPSVSTVLPDGTLVELIKDDDGATAFAVYRDSNWTIEQSVTTDDGTRLVPYSARNNLLLNDVVLLPGEPLEYESEDALVAEVQAFIHKYVDVSGRFERITAFYVLFTYLYDCFSEVPYLRLRGEYGSGKTRFLLTVGALCHKPIFTSGASTVSPIFHTLDAFRGTLILDEADFRFSDEKADIVKILNNGNVKGIPVLRCETHNGKEFNPRAFYVFGPKIIAQRGHYNDRALESRFITEETGSKSLRAEIPINLPPEYADEARTLRSKLLLYRFRKYEAARTVETIADDSVEPRLKQILSPLAAVTFIDAVHSDIWAIAREANRDLIADRGLAIEAQLLAVIRCVATQSGTTRITVAEITDAFKTAFAQEYDRAITNRWIGSLLRKRLFLKTQKSHGTYVIAPTEIPRLELLYERYGIGGDEVTAVAETLETDSSLVWEKNENG